MDALSDHGQSSTSSLSSKKIFLTSDSIKGKIKILYEALSIQSSLVVEKENNSGSPDSASPDRLS